MDLHRILNPDSAEAKCTQLCAHSKSLKKYPLRAGKWTREEEAYTVALIEAFLNGSLDLPEGASLRLFLAKKLFCPPMRVTTKLSTNILDGRPIRNRLGQLRYFPVGNSENSSASKRRLAELEVAFRMKAQIPLEVDIGCSTREYTNKRPLRVGSWTKDEELYALALIAAFQNGCLDIDLGTTLRTFLAKHLCCDKMRITKKLSHGCIARRKIESCIGRLRYRPALMLTSSEAKYVLDKLARLQRNCFTLCKEKRCDR